MTNFYDIEQFRFIR